MHVKAILSPYLFIYYIFFGVGEGRRGPFLRTLITVIHFYVSEP